MQEGFDSFQFASFSLRVFRRRRRGFGPCRRKNRIWLLHQNNQFIAAKSRYAFPTCLAGMITGAALASVYYNLKLRHPKLDLPIIDYNLALLFQPMLVLGISIGVFFNVVFAEWMVTVLLIVLFIGTSTKAFFKGIETWKKETVLKKKLAARCLASDYTGNEEAGYKLLPGGPTDETKMFVNKIKPSKVSIINNVLWKEMGILFAVWTIILVLHISKDFTALCSETYWTVTLLQIPVAIGAFGYQAVCLYQGCKVVESTGDARIEWTVPKLILCCICGMLSGIVGGLLGLGGGFIMGPLLLELGIPPQVSSATATFVMAFSSSMSVIQYYLLKRFPPSYGIVTPHHSSRDLQFYEVVDFGHILLMTCYVVFFWSALYFVAVATIAALVGQFVVRKMISLFQRASLIIFVLAFTIFISAILLGWVGIENIIGRVQGDEHLWFYNICEYVP